MSLYQSSLRVRREWFCALKRSQGFNIGLIEEELLRSCHEIVSAEAREKEFEEVRIGSLLPHTPSLMVLPYPSHAPHRFIHTHAIRNQLLHFQTLQTPTCYMPPKWPAIHAMSPIWLLNRR